MHAFAHRAPQRDNLTEMGVRQELAMEPDLHKWLALWNAPGL